MDRSMAALMWASAILILLSATISPFLFGLSHYQHIASTIKMLTFVSSVQLLFILLYRSLENLRRTIGIGLPLPLVPGIPIQGRNIDVWVENSLATVVEALTDFVVSKGH